MNSMDLCEGEWGSGMVDIDDILVDKFINSFFKYWKLSSKCFYLW